MKAVVLAVLALLIVCAIAQRGKPGRPVKPGKPGNDKPEDPECQRLREKRAEKLAGGPPGSLKERLAKRDEYLARLKALGCKAPRSLYTSRRREPQECKPLREKLRKAKAEVPQTEQSTNPKILDLNRQLDALRCVKRSRPLTERIGEDPECDHLRAKIRQVRATTGDADKEAREAKIKEWKERMTQKKCVSRRREDPQCKEIRDKIKAIRANVAPGARAEVEKKVKEYIGRLRSLKCRRPRRQPITRQNEDPECAKIRSKIRTARLTLKDKKELDAKTAEYKKRLDSLKCAKRRVIPEERKNEHPDCSGLRAKIRKIRADSASSSDKSAVEKKVQEYKDRLRQLKCIRIRKPQPARGRCYVTGCNKELCTDKPGSFSACVFKPEFQCYKTAKCGLYGENGSCGWEKTPELYQCLAMSGVKPTA